LEIALPGYSVWLRAWQVQVGRAKLYLLDSNDAANFPAHRGITSELYGGGPELRLKQELLLGVGGWRLLRALGIKAEVCHLNEGHAAFAVLERARNFMEDTGSPSKSLWPPREQETSLPRTPQWLPVLTDSLRPSSSNTLGGMPKRGSALPFTICWLLAAESERLVGDFYMAYLAIRGSGAVNGVSRLHGKVSRHLFRSLFRHWRRTRFRLAT